MQVLTSRSHQRTGCINHFSAAREMSNHKKPVCAGPGLVHMGRSLCCIRSPSQKATPTGVCHWCVLVSAVHSTGRTLFKPQQSSFPYSCFLKLQAKHKRTFKTDLVCCCHDKMLFPEKSVFVLYNLWEQNKICSEQRLFIFRPEYNYQWFQQLWLHLVREKSLREGRQYPLQCKMETLVKLTLQGIGIFWKCI